AHRFTREIEEDSEAGQRIGAHATPTLFINGRLQPGYEEYPVMASLLDEEFAYADALLGKGTARTQLYERLLEGARTEAPRAAGDQGRFWPMHDRLIKNPEGLDLTTIEKHAAALHLDMNRFRKALDAVQHQAQIERDVAAAEKLDVDGTPTFFINGRRLKGAV